VQGRTLNTTPCPGRESVQTPPIALTRQSPHFPEGLRATLPCSRSRIQQGEGEEGREEGGPGGRPDGGRRRAERGGPEREARRLEGGWGGGGRGIGTGSSRANLAITEPLGSTQPKVALLSEQRGLKTWTVAKR